MTYNYNSVTTLFCSAIAIDSASTRKISNCPAKTLVTIYAPQYVRWRLHYAPPLLPADPTNHSNLFEIRTSRARSQSDCGLSAKPTTPYLFCPQKAASLAIELEIIFQTSITPSVKSIFRWRQQFCHSKSLQLGFGPLRD